MKTTTIRVMPIWLNVKDMNGLRVYGEIKEVKIKEIREDQVLLYAVVIVDEEPKTG